MPSGSRPTPTAFQLGEGADLRAPLAATVLGGVISSTALTLVVVPVMYTLLDGLHSTIGRRLGGLLKLLIRRRPLRALAAGRRDAAQALRDAA